jgi:hypothetical protein
MQSLFIEYIYLILIILALVMIANKLRLYLSLIDLEEFKIREKLLQPDEGNIAS